MTFGMKFGLMGKWQLPSRGLGLEWALKDIGDCIGEMVKMSGHATVPDGEMDMGDRDLAPTAPPTQVITGPAQFIVDIDDASVDCIVFDPPYHNNVNYAELSDFFYVWLKRTAGYVLPEHFTEHLADKTNEAIASPARFRTQAAAAKVADRKSKVSASKARHRRLPRQDARDIRRVPPRHQAR